MLNNTKVIHIGEEKSRKQIKNVVLENNVDCDEQNNVIIIDYNNKAKCIICGKQTDGLLFCSSCYHKYKNKELLFRITNCTSVELLDGNLNHRKNTLQSHFYAIFGEKVKAIIFSYDDGMLQDRRLAELFLTYTKFY